MKKIQIVTIVLLMGLLTACGSVSKGSSSEKGSKNQSSKVTKGKKIELGIENGTYIEPMGGDNEDKTEYIALDLKFKNLSKEKIFVTESSFYLFEKGNDVKISPTRMDHTQGFDMVGQDLPSGKSATGTVVFEVDSSKKYVLAMSTLGIDFYEEKQGDVEVNLDLSKYEDSKKTLEEPKKALDAFIDVVLLQKENADYEKLVGNNSAEDIAAVEKEFGKQLKDYSFYEFKPSEEEYKATYKEFVKNQNKRVEVKNVLLGNNGKKANVEVEFKGISWESVNDMISEERRKFLDESADYDSEKADRFAYSKLTEIYGIADIGEPRSDIKVNMTKKDDKWFFDFNKSDNYENKQLIKAFLGDVR